MTTKDDITSVYKKEPANSASEVDVTTAWRKLYCYTSRPGVCKKIKRQIQKRSRLKIRTLLRRYDG